jgi:indole-3-glycerol phosphate synthase
MSAAGSDGSSRAGGVPADAGDFLAGMAAASAARVAAARAALPEPELLARVADTPTPVQLKLSPRRFDLIAEVKFRSPAMGPLREGNPESVRQRVAGYAEAGAAVVSVLTEPSRFDGSLDHLTTAAIALAGKVPAMRKDFLVDPYQVAEARLAGAGGVLVILRMLDDARIDAMLAAAAALRMFVLLEAFDEADIARAHRAVAQQPTGLKLLVGLNCRDLRTLQVVPGRLEQLAKSLPDSVPRVAESGVATPEDAGRMAVAGYDAALVGGALMSALEPLPLVRAMLASGRRERAQRS